VVVVTGAPTIPPLNIPRLRRQKRMSERRRRPGSCVLLATLILVGCVSGDEDAAPAIDTAEGSPSGRPVEISSFSDWDEDGDQHLDAREFGMWTQDEDVFGDWIRVEGVDIEIFHEHLQTALDANADGDIDERDWSAGIQRLLGDGDSGAWSDWDTDGDGELRGPEFIQAAEDHGLNARVDSDGDAVITQQELRDFYFGIFDRNGDGRLDSNEWSQGRATWLGHDDV
jgi:hypothetical protein